MIHPIHFTLAKGMRPLFPNVSAEKQEDEHNHNKRKDVGVNLHDLCSYVHRVESMPSGKGPPDTIHDPLIEARA